MAIWTLPLLFASAALAHTGVKSILIDGQVWVCFAIIRLFLTFIHRYPPFESRIDHLLGPVKRIEWSHDVVYTTFNPITNFSDPSLACKYTIHSIFAMLIGVLGRENSRPPALKAPARAGADIGLWWTPITRMHNGPILAYLGYLPTPDTPPQDVKFFKIFEKGFDVSQGKYQNMKRFNHTDKW